MDILKPDVKSEVLIPSDDVKEEIIVEPLLQFVSEPEVHSLKVENHTKVKSKCIDVQYKDTEDTVVHVNIKQESLFEQFTDTVIECSSFKDWKDSRNENECETILGMVEDENIRPIYLEDKGQEEVRSDNTEHNESEAVTIQQQTSEVSLVEELFLDPVEEISEINENEPTDVESSTVSENVEVVYDSDDEGNGPSEEYCNNIDDDFNQTVNTEEETDCSTSVVVGSDYGYYIQIPHSVSDNGIVRTNVNTESCEVYAISDEENNSESSARLENEVLRHIVPDTGGSILRAALLRGSKHIVYNQKSQGYISKTKESSASNNHYCSSCGKSFRKAVSVQIHYSLVHSRHNKLNNESFACLICRKVFSSRGKLLKHSKIHNPLFKCTICGKQFSEKYRLKKHLKTHVNETPASCFVCGKHFLKKKFLDAHMLGHGLGKKFSCPICNKSFSKQCYLKQHSVIHEGIVSVTDV